MFPIRLLQAVDYTAYTVTGVGKGIRPQTLAPNENCHQSEHTLIKLLQNTDTPLARSNKRQISVR